MYSVAGLETYYWDMNKVIVLEEWLTGTYDKRMLQVGCPGLKRKLRYSFVMKTVKKEMIQLCSCKSTPFVLVEAWKRW